MYRVYSRRGSLLALRRPVITLGDREIELRQKEAERKRMRERVIERPEIYIKRD